MTLPHIPDPKPGDAAAADAIEMVLIPNIRNIGAFDVQRVLPSARRQMVGPFIFFDQFGPVQLRAGQGMDVRPHPHIGLSTVTWLFDGVVYHRDSLGSQQAISPGELNWMTAGRGIVHSERSLAADRMIDRKVFGLQSWVALPKKFEETAPSFEHVDHSDLPFISDHGREVRVIAGEIYGARSPVKTHSDLFYADVKLAAGARLPLPIEHEERGVYLIEGNVEMAGQQFSGGRLLVIKPKEQITLLAVTDCHFMLLGGEPMDGPRHIWWNFVSSSKERLEAAKEDWKRARFDIVPGDETEFIPLPS